MKLQQMLRRLMIVPLLCQIPKATLTALTHLLISVLIAGWRRKDDITDNERDHQDLTLFAVSHNYLK